MAKGCNLKPGIDYDETFSPVVMHSTLRLLIAISVHLDLKTTHLDVTTAFLNGSLTETVYMMQPEGFEESINKTMFLNLKEPLMV